MADVRLSEMAVEQLEKLPTIMKARVARIFERLENWPQVSGAKTLSGNLAGLWRIRTGDYRVQFSVAGDIVLVEKIGHRDGFYDDG